MRLQMIAVAALAAAGPSSVKIGTAALISPTSADSFYGSATTSTTSPAPGSPQPSGKQTRPSEHSLSLRQGGCALDRPTAQAVTTSPTMMARFPGLMGRRWDRR